MCFSVTFMKCLTLIHLYWELWKMFCNTFYLFVGNVGRLEQFPLMKALIIFTLLITPTDKKRSVEESRKTKSQYESNTA